MPPLQRVILGVYSGTDAFQGVRVEVVVRCYAALYVQCKFIKVACGCRCVG